MSRTEPTTPGVRADGAYHPDAVEAKWQARWAERHTNEPDLERARRPFYNLMMFPYPSAEGLHVGNMFAFTGSDVYGRFQRLRGYDVFEPMGFDAFGIHSENYAIKVGVNPAELIPRNIENFRRQLKRIGGMFDWRHQLSTTDPDYYRWTQWIFLQLYRAGKAYKRRAAVNWCPNDKTVLANEQVINGHCERCGAAVEQRMLDQWFFRITEYADRLLADLDDRSRMDWSESTVTAQRNWLGRSEGAEIDFPVDGGQADGSEDTPAIRVYTTRPDTIFGATFMVLAPEHPLVDALTAPGQRDAVDAYRAQAAKQDLVSRKVGERDKTGVFTGGYATNPATGARIPVWIADYVLMEYGTGAIMAVPAHDERDFEFARKFGLDVVPVIAEPGGSADAPAGGSAGTLDAAYTDTEMGRLVNSARFTGLSVPDGKRAITGWLESIGAGRGVAQYRLHDWCISRQRYWGPPIPIIYCDACGPVAVPEKDLPVLLPIIEDFRPDDSGVSPLARHEEWYYAACPECGRRGRRETDVSDTFLDSSWYYLRYPSTGDDTQPFDPALTRKWLPVTAYIGGNEHAVLHLLYSRFISMVLHELGYIDFDEPFRKFRAHGLIVKDGAKMSKSRGNVVVPDEYIAKWGADTFRLYLMGLGPFQEGGDFRDAGISGPRRMLDKIWQLVADSIREDACGGEIHPEILIKWHRTKKKVTEDLEELKYNTAIAAITELLNLMREENCREREVVEEMVIMLAPLAPHFAEECWERLGHDMSVFDAKWPPWEERLTIEDTIELPVQINGKTRAKVRVRRGAAQDDAVSAALADAAVKRFVEGKEVRKTILVPDRLLSLVVG
ncbi:MAG TPA: leucine--tRNA ligase [Gemmatimonadales bacterium]|nr:leucine--tRNA ligase [Gemmatimonadales bacterium]